MGEWLNIIDCIIKNNYEHRTNNFVYRNDDISNSTCRNATFLHVEDVLSPRLTCFFSPTYFFLFEAIF